jgi:hypothetical protein
MGMVNKPGPQPKSVTVSSQKFTPCPSTAEQRVAYPEEETVGSEHPQIK